MVIDQSKQLDGRQGDMPLVSVVIATYNGLKYVKYQLDSILAQTYPNTEIVITDDSSTDGTQEFLQAYASRYKNINLLLNHENVGYTKNFEKGMLACKGDLIAPCDQDDVWKPEKIERLVNTIGDNDIVYCDSELINADGNLIGVRMSQLRKYQNFRDVLNFTVGNSAPGHAMLIKRKIVQRALPFPTLIPHDFWLGFVATLSYGLFYLDEVHVQYRQHNDNVFGGLSSRTRTGKTSKRTKATNQLLRTKAITRIEAMYKKCPKELKDRKRILKSLYESYQSFSFFNNWKRMIIFFTYRDKILAYKRRSEIRRILYCFKLFFTIQ